jgi:hypothetical protein
MALQVLQRFMWDGEPKHQADWFRLQKHTHGDLRDVLASIRLKPAARG